MHLPLTILFTAFFLFICATPPFTRRFRTLGLWPWALTASVLMIYGGAGFYSGVLSAAGAFDRFSSFEYPIWHADAVVTRSDGTHAVAHKPSARIQLYDRDWRFLRGWRVRSGGGDFRFLNVSEDRIEIFIERGDFRDTYDWNGNRVDVAPPASPRPGTFAASSPGAALPSRPWLWPFSSNGLASLIWMSGLAILLACHYRVNRATAAPSAGPRQGAPMTMTGSAVPSVVIAMAGAVALCVGPTTISAQPIIDLENRYPHVGVIMVWRVDGAGKPVELRGFASGTLIRDRVMVTAGHFTAPATTLGSLPPSIRMFASFSPTDAKDPKTWIPVVRYATHPSMPPCPPPPQCDPTDEILVAPLEPGIADVGLVFLAHAPPGIRPARLAGHGLLARSEGAPTTIVGYGTTAPKERHAPPDIAMWDGKRRIRTSILRRVVDETWALWAIPSYVCSGDSGGGIFLKRSSADEEVLVANVSDGGLDCRRHNNNNRLDTRSVQDWIKEALRQYPDEP